MSVTPYPNTSVVAGEGNAGTPTAIQATEEGHLEVAIHDPINPFGSVHAEGLSVIDQWDGVYGINTALMVTTTGNSLSGGAATTATVTSSNNLLVCATGTTAYDFATLQGRRRVRYRPGQGVVARYTAIFTTGVASSTQVAGVGTAESGYYFGYNGTAFGILSNTGGVREIRTLTVTTRSTATNNYNVQLNGVTTNVTATSNASTTQTANEIAAGTYPGWSAEAVGATVVFVADSAGSKSGSYSLAQSGAGTPAAGTFAQTLAGAAVTNTWVAQTAWNGDKLNGTGPSGVTLDPTKGNVYQIKIQYLGFGSIVFQVEVTPSNSNNPTLVTVHTIKFPNTSTSVNQSQPAFPFTAAAYSAGSTTNLSVSIGSWGGFVEGEVQHLGPRSNFESGASGSVSTTMVPLFSIRNDNVFKSRANQCVVYLLSCGAAQDHTKPSTLYVLRNATLNLTANWTQFSTTSAIYIDTGATSVSVASNSQIVFSMPIPQNGGITYAFSDRQITVQPGETITVAAKAASGTATTFIANLNTREDQ